MKYNIISINEDRAEYKNVIRKRLHLDEVSIPAVNGYEVDVNEELTKRGISTTLHGAYSRGEIGIWLSTFDRWQWAVDHNEELVVFEDDAVPSVNFKHEFPVLIEELPDDYDFLCLWVPDNQRIDYCYNVEYDEHGDWTQVGTHRTAETSIYNFGARHLAKAYNGYGNVAQLYSPKGAKYFIDRVRETGIFAPVDCFLYIEAHTGRCDGYSPKPSRAYIVSYDWKAATTVHKEDRV